MGSRTPKPDDFSPDFVFATGHRYEGRPRCLAWNGNAGRQCKKLPEKGPSQKKHPADPAYKTVCGTHGGKTPAGTESPHFKHGRYSAILPDRLALRYEEARQDEDLLSLREEIALLEPLIVGEIEAAYELEEKADWAKAEELFSKFRKAAQAGRAEDVRRYDRELRELFSAGLQADNARSRLLDLIEARRRLSESERKRLVDLQQYITAERALTLISSVAGLIGRFVEDDDARRRIAEELRRLTHRDAGLSRLSGE